MGLFKPDLYRNFAIGFALGALAVAVQFGTGGWSDPIPQAHAQAVEAAAE